MWHESSCTVDVASVGSSASEKGPGSGRNSPVVKDKKLFKSTGVKKEVGSLGKSSDIFSQISNVHKEWDLIILQCVLQCAVSENIHTSPKEMIFVLRTHPTSLEIPIKIYTVL